MRITYPASAAELPFNATLLCSFDSREQAEEYCNAGDRYYAILPPSMGLDGKIVWTVFELPVEE